MSAGDVRLGRMRAVLLRAYPAGARRDELVDTLLMAAADGAVGRVTVGEAAGLVRHGLRARLGRPGGVGVVVLAVIVSAVTGFLGASLVNRVGWEAAPPLPAAGELGALGELVTPGLPADWYRDEESAFRDNGGETDAASVGYGIDHTPETQQVTAYLAGVRERLEGAGWRVTDSWSTSAVDTATETPVNDSTAMVARTGELVMVVENYYDPDFAEGYLSVVVYRAEPGWLIAVTVAGGVLASLLGWLIVGWASRRVADRPVVTTFAAFTATVGALLLVPPMLLGLVYLDTLRGRGLPDSPFWRGLVPTDEFGGFALPAVVSLALALLRVAFVRPETAAERGDTGSVRSAG